MKFNLPKSPKKKLSNAKWLKEAVAYSPYHKIYKNIKTGVTSIRKSK